MAIITTIADVALGFEVPIDEQDPARTRYIMGLIARAERKLSSRLGDLTEWANTDDRTAALRDVVSEMVQKVLRAGGSTMKSESDGGYTYQVDPMVASANLWVTDDMWDQLTGGPAYQPVRSARLVIPAWSGRAIESEPSPW